MFSSTEPCFESMYYFGFHRAKITNGDKKFSYEGSLSKAMDIISIFYFFYSFNEGKHFNRQH